jgi:hypothetical protein
MLSHSTNSSIGIAFVYRQEVPTHDVPLSCKVRQHKLADDYLGNKLIRRSYVEESS